MPIPLSPHDKDDLRYLIHREVKRYLMHQPGPVIIRYQDRRELIFLEREARRAGIRERIRLVK